MILMLFMFSPQILGIFLQKNSNTEWMNDDLHRRRQNTMYWAYQPKRKKKS